MNLKELVAALKAGDDGVFQKLNDKQARDAAQAVLAEVRKAIDATEEGKVAVPPLGRFIIKQAKREKDGQEVTVKQVRLAPPGAKAGGKKGGKKAAAE